MGLCQYTKLSTAVARAQLWCTCHKCYRGRNIQTDLKSRLPSHSFISQRSSCHSRVVLLSYAPRQRAQPAEQRIVHFYLLLCTYISPSGIAYLNLAHDGSCMNRTRNCIGSIMNDFGSSEVKGNRVRRICMSLTDTLWYITMLLTCQKMWFSSHWLFQFTLFAFLISKWVPHGQMINYTIIHCSTFFSCLSGAHSI